MRRYKSWTRKTKIALIVAIVSSVLLAVFYFYVWPGQLYATLVGIAVFLFLTFFNFRGVVLGLLVSVFTFFLLAPFSEGFGTIMLPVSLIVFCIVVTSEKLMSRGGTLSKMSKGKRFPISVALSLLAGVFGCFAGFLLTQMFVYWTNSADIFWLNRLIIFGGGIGTSLLVFLALNRQNVNSAISNETTHTVNSK